MHRVRGGLLVCLIAMGCAAPAAPAAPTTTVQRTIQDCDGDNLLEYSFGEEHVAFGSPLRDPGLHARGRRGATAAPPQPRLDHQLPPALGLPGRRRGVTGARRVPRRVAARAGAATVLGGLPAAGGAVDPGGGVDGPPGSQHDLAGHRQRPRSHDPHGGQRRLPAVQRDALVHRHARRHDGERVRAIASSTELRHPDARLRGHAGLRLRRRARLGPPGPDDGYYEPDASSGPRDDGDGYSPDRERNDAESRPRRHRARLPGAARARQRALRVARRWGCRGTRRSATTTRSSRATTPSLSRPAGTLGEHFNGALHAVVTGCAKVQQPSPAVAAAITPPGPGRRPARGRRRLRRGAGPDRPAHGRGARQGDGRARRSRQHVDPRAARPASLLRRQGRQRRRAPGRPRPRPLQHGQLDPPALPHDRHAGGPRLRAQRSRRLREVWARRGGLPPGRLAGRPRAGAARHRPWPTTTATTPSSRSRACASSSSTRSPTSAGPRSAPRARSTTRSSGGCGARSSRPRARAST